MTLPIYAAGIAVLAYFLYKLLYGTDTPHIKGLPEVPGLPLFGSLYELGTCHAKVAQGWANKYWPVFEVRMGNRVPLQKPGSLEMLKLRDGSAHQECHRESCLPMPSNPFVTSGLQTSRP